MPGGRREFVRGGVPGRTRVPLHMTAFNMVIKEWCDVLRRSTEVRSIQFCRGRREHRKICTKRQGRFFQSPRQSALG